MRTHVLVATTNRQTFDADPFKTALAGLRRMAPSKKSIRQCWQYKLKIATTDSDFNLYHR